MALHRPATRGWHPSAWGPCPEAPACSAIRVRSSPLNCGTRSHLHVPSDPATVPPSAPPPPPVRWAFRQILLISESITCNVVCVGVGWGGSVVDAPDLGDELGSTFCHIHLRTIPHFHSSAFPNFYIPRFLYFLTSAFPHFSISAFPQFDISTLPQFYCSTMFSSSFHVSAFPHIYISAFSAFSAFPTSPHPRISTPNFHISAILLFYISLHISCFLHVCEMWKGGNVEMWRPAGVEGMKDLHPRL